MDGQGTHKGMPLRGSRLGNANTMEKGSGLSAPLSLCQRYVGGLVSGQPEAPAGDDVALDFRCAGADGGGVLIQRSPGEGPVEPCPL